MKFKIKSQILLTNIKKIMRITPSNPIKDFYKNIKIEVEDNQILFYSENERLSLRFSLLAQEENLIIYQTGSFLINLKILYEVLNKLNNEWILFEIIINKLIINNFDKNNNFILKLNMLETKEFPKTDFSKTNNTITLAKTLIEDINNQITFVINTNNNSSILQGINFDFKKNNLLITATDRTSIAQKKITIKDNPFNKNITIPIFLLNNIEKIAHDLNHDYLFYLNHNQELVIEIANFLIKGRLLIGDYPKIQNFIADYLELKNKTIVKINDLKIFLNTIDLAIILAKKESVPLIKLVFDQKNNKIEIICVSSNNFGEVHEQFNNIKFLNQTQNEIIIVFNYYFLTNALKTFSRCKKIKLNIINNNYHTVITSDEDQTLWQLILPVIKV